MASGPRVANARRRMTSSIGTNEPSSCTATENQSLCVGFVTADHTIVRSANITVSTIPNISSFSHVGTEMDLTPAILSNAMESLSLSFGLRKTRLRGAFYQHFPASRIKYFRPGIIHGSQTARNENFDSFMPLL